MSERAYTVQEIDALRVAVELKYLYGTYRLSEHGGASRSYYPEEKVKAVEEMVRTWMLAGKTAQDLYDSERGSGEPQVTTIFRGSGGP